MIESLEALNELFKIGYRAWVEGGAVKLRYEGAGDPDPRRVTPLLDVLKTHKEEVRRYLVSIREKAAAAPERILSCNECPWYSLNPWGPDEELGAWCHYQMEHLLMDNPSCLGRRHGMVPPRETGKDLAQENSDPHPGRQRCPMCDGGRFWQHRDGPWICQTCHPPPHPSLVQATQEVAGEPKAPTCGRCASFQAARLNPAEGFGRCSLPEVSGRPGAHPDQAACRHFSQRSQPAGNL